MPSYSCEVTRDGGIEFDCTGISGSVWHFWTRDQLSFSCAVIRAQLLGTVASSLIVLAFLEACGISGGVMNCHFDEQFFVCSYFSALSLFAASTRISFIVLAFLKACGISGSVINCPCHAKSFVRSY